MVMKLEAMDVSDPNHTWDELRAEADRLERLGVPDMRRAFRVEYDGDWVHK